VDEVKKDKQKPKNSRLALFAFLIPVLYLIASCCVIYANSLNLNTLIPFGVFSGLCGVVVMSYLFVLPISFILGFIAAIRIVLGKKLLKGCTFSILGILLSVWAFFLSAEALCSGRDYAAERQCQSNMKQLGNLLKDYSRLHDGQYPAPNKWCDILLAFWMSQNQTKVRADRAKFNITSDEWFLTDVGFYCPRYEGYRFGQQSSYAINSDCRLDSPPDTVLLFELDVMDWNEYGGLESVAFNHPIISIFPFRGAGCNVLFNDGHVELVSSRKIGKLKWKDERAK
jgi:prepilin-type processing-associated H-X9-DG protein